MLKAKLMVLVLVLGSIDFICGGCQSCKGNKGNNQSKSNGNSGDPKKIDDGKDNGTEGGKKVLRMRKYTLKEGMGSEIGSKKGKEGKVENEEEKKKKEDISNLLNNNKGSKRQNTKGKFEVEIDKDNFIIKYGNFTGTIAKNDVANPIEDSELTINVTRPDGETNIKFDNGGKCTLGDFVTALGFLKTDLRNDAGDEYLRADDKNKTCMKGGAIFINLSNGLIYKCRGGYIKRANVKNGDYDQTVSPCYYSGNYYHSYYINNNGKKDGKYELWNEKIHGGKAEDLFKEPKYNAEDIGKFEFKLKID